MGILQIILVVVLLGSSGYGIYICVTKKAPLYLQLVICAMVACAFSALDSSLLYSLLGIYPEGFKISNLSMFASFMFIFSANYGTMDDIIDERRKEDKKYRLLALFAPLVIILQILLFALFCNTSMINKIFTAIASIPAMFASYYNLKHIIFPDISEGFVKAMRSYNIVALLFLYSTMFLTISSYFEGYVIYNVATIMCIIVDLLIIPICKYGIDKRKKLI